MSTKDEARKMAENEKKITCVPVLNIRMMTDEEWNRLAYRNYLDRRATA